MIRARKLIALGALGASLAAAGSAGAREFGANLNRAANNTASCQSLIFFQRVPSCSWTTSGGLASLRERLLVPATGRITYVRIRGGANTGPMRIAILQSLRKENGGEAACCIGRRQSRVFTPRPNRITRVNVNLPVLGHLQPQFATPIPANVIADTTNGNCSGGWFPAVRPGQENFIAPYAVCGATILIRPNWVRR